MTQHILLAEPDPAVRQTLVHLFRPLGFQVSAVSNAAAVEATLGKGDAAPIDVLVLADRLPGGAADADTDAVALADRISARHGVPVLLLVDAARSEASREQSHHCLAKPFNLADLLDAVQDTMLARVS